MTEKELQAAVIELARWSGWTYMHITDSRKSAAVGFPDLVLLHQTTGRLLFVELKSEKGRLRPEQVVWLGLLGHRHEALVWRPADLTSGDIEAVLTGEMKRAAA